MRIGSDVETVETPVIDPIVVRRSAFAVKGWTYAENPQPEPDWDALSAGEKFDSPRWIRMVIIASEAQPGTQTRKNLPKTQNGPQPGAVKQLKTLERPGGIEPPTFSLGS
jgi:hypothetical protein